jgi:hypothetical protein
VGAQVRLPVRTSGGTFTVTAGPDPDTATVTLTSTFEPLDPTGVDQLTDMRVPAVAGLIAPLHRRHTALGYRPSRPPPCQAGAMAVAFTGQVRQWRDDKPGGLAVVDIPSGLVADLGRRQMRVTGTLNTAPFTGSTTLVAGGGLCVGVSKAALKAAGAAVGDEVHLSVTPVSKE